MSSKTSLFSLYSPEKYLNSLCSLQSAAEQKPRPQNVHHVDKLTQSSSCGSISPLHALKFNTVDGSAECFWRGKGRRKEWRRGGGGGGGLLWWMKVGLSVNGSLTLWCSSHWSSSLCVFSLQPFNDVEKVSDDLWPSLIFSNILFTLFQ